MNAYAYPPFPPSTEHYFKDKPLDEVLAWDQCPYTYVKMASRSEIDRRILLLPNIVSDPEGCFKGLCAFCGEGFMRDHITSIPRHFNEDGSCRSGFTSDHTCVCGETFETTSRASKHRIQHDCLRTRIRRAAIKKARDEELKRLFCEPCKHQSHTAKEHEAHCKTKHHHRTTNPTEFDCADCGLHFEFKSELDRHLKTKSHTKTSLTCEPCGVTCRCKSEYDRHCAGKVHRYTVNPSDRPNLTCELCGITRPSAAQYQAHLATAKHRKKEAEARSEDPSSPDDADASGSPDTPAPVPTHSPPPVC